MDINGTHFDIYIFRLGNHIYVEHLCKVHRRHGLLAKLCLFLLRAHASAQTQHQVEGGPLLNVVFRDGAAILELFAPKDQSLLIWRSSFFVLDPGLDILNGVGGLNLQSDGLA